MTPRLCRDGTKTPPRPSPHAGREKPVACCEAAVPLDESWGSPLRKGERDAPTLKRVGIQVSPFRRGLSFRMAVGSLHHPASITTGLAARATGRSPLPSNCNLCLQSRLRPGFTARFPHFYRKPRPWISAHPGAVFRSRNPLNINPNPALTLDFCIYIIEGVLTTDTHDARRADR
jgi:hypothetical protein